MKLKNILIVVKDIEASKQFYHDLFGLNLVLDNDGNMVLTEGLVLQDEKIWRKFLGKDVIPKSNHVSTALSVNCCSIYGLKRITPSIMSRMFPLWKNKIGSKKAERF